MASYSSRTMRLDDKLKFSMTVFIVCWLFLNSFVFIAATDVQSGGGNGPAHAMWIVNYPEVFGNESYEFGNLVDERNSPDKIKLYEENGELYRWMTTASDGENTDVIDHFFWGQSHGLSIELGGLDGSPQTNSQTANLVKLGWNRIIIEGNPEHRENMKLRSPDALGVNAVICEKFGKVHYARSNYVSGILEFMESRFISEFHTEIYNSAQPPGNLSSVDWSKHSNVHEVDCVPLSHILHKARAHHVNFFLLDVEGGELEVLKSIHWNKVKFDVLCVETEVTQRPPHFAEQVTNLLSEHGYVNATGQFGRNIWYIRKDFVPFTRPGMAPDCFNGHRKFMSLVAKYLGPSGERWKNFQPCPVVST